MKVFNKIKFFKNIVFTYRNWPTAILDALWYFPQGETKLYKLRNGLTFRCRNSTTDLSVVHSLFIKKDNAEFVDELPDKSNVVDIGANIGTFTVYVGSKKPNANIFSYEPMPSNFKLLNENILLNKVKGAKTFQMAVSNKRTVQKLYFSSEKYNAGASLLKVNGQKVSSVDVKSVTVEDIIRSNKIKHIDLLKLDCEGMDYKIINSIKKSTFAKISRIHAEYHTNFEKKQLVSKLENNGFLPTCVDSGGYGNVYARKSVGA